MSFASESSNLRSNRVRRQTVDTFIAVLLLAFALDTMPCTPQFIRRRLSPALNATGLWQGTWSLFAPIPDARNHRLRADITFRDGTHHTWNSPDWRSQSAWRRFVSHRHSEFYEKIGLDENSVAWRAFTRVLVREELSKNKLASSPRQVELSVLWRDIPPPPARNKWLIEPRAPLDQKRQFFTYSDADP